MNIFSYLFQPDKSKLSPAGRAFIAWLEIVIISIPIAVGGAGLDYLNGHPNDFSGMVPFIVSAMVVALLKAFTTLGVSMKNTSVTTGAPTAPPAPVPPPVIVNNTLPPMPAPQFYQIPPAPPPMPLPSPPPLPPAVAQFKTPVATFGAPGVSETVTARIPVIGLAPPVDMERDWTGLEIPVALPH